LKPVHLTRQARADIAEAADYYEQKSEGLGDKFVDRVLEAVEKIAANPHGYAKVFQNLRRCNVPKFAYALWFEIRPDNSLVVACLHAKRSSQLAKERVPVVEMPKPPKLR
jgi:toxin ParE1/3/4